MHPASDVPVERDQPGIHRPRHLLPRREDESAHIRQQRRDAVRGPGGNFGERDFLGHGGLNRLRDELRRELPAPAEDVAPRLVDDIQLLAVEGFHFSIQGVRNNRHTSDVIEIACGNQADVLLKRISVEAIGKL